MSEEPTLPKSAWFDEYVDDETEEMEAEAIVLDPVPDKPKKKPPVKSNEPEQELWLDKLTGAKLVTNPRPPLPRGPKPDGKPDKLRYRIDPERKHVVQCKWNRENQSWSDYVLCQGNSDARSTLAVLTTASWRLEPMSGVSGRKTE